MAPDSTNMLHNEEVVYKQFMKFNQMAETFIDHKIHGGGASPSAPNNHLTFHYSDISKNFHANYDNTVDHIKMDKCYASETHGTCHIDQITSIPHGYTFEVYEDAECKKRADARYNAADRLQYPLTATKPGCSFKLVSTSTCQKKVDITSGKCE